MTLRELIDETPWVDTHEHLVEEHTRLDPGGYEFYDITGEKMVIPADWSALVIHYAIHDLVGAGLSAGGIQRLLSPELSPLEKWDVVEPCFEAARNAGYLHAVDLSTERLCGMRLSRDTCEAVDAQLAALRVDGWYGHVLPEVANISCCHVNTLESDPFCETRLPGLLLQDLSIAPLACGRHAAVEAASGIEVGSLDDYIRVVEWCFERYAGEAVAAKCVWAYQRPLAVQPPEAPPRAQFARLRADAADLAEQREVEDFLFQRCLDLATEAGLPVKIHLGYLDGHHHPQFRHVYDHVRDITPIVQANRSTSFVLMHTAWPQQEQLLALAKQQPNVTLDLCWAWILAPLATREFLERALTTIPASKLLCFGGDHMVVENVVGHAEIARRGLQTALQRLVDEHWLTDAHARALVPMLMRENAERIFPSRAPAALDAGGTT
ncbi:MAG TPA: amidohydrolase family protein [Solirubrobacteraceae bacterium]|nr:amidohydrolase family protein [Solirubrobacteraceae bacterium]